MLTLDTVIREAAACPDGRSLIEQFVPPPRFASKRFEGYRPDPKHPSQRAALEGLRGVAASLDDGGWGRLARRARAAVGRPRRGGGVYLDGGFGVGKTHLLAALWNVAPAPKAYLSFDELVYTIGLLGVKEARAAFHGLRLVAIDEWELDDPGNLQLALAFLRGALAGGVQVVTTSNTIPSELGGRGFSQKDFRSEIEELAGAFEVLRMAGEDFRHRHFTADPGREYFLGEAELRMLAVETGERALLVSFDELLAALEQLHPIRYAALVRAVDAVFVQKLAPFTRLPQALRWVHFIDKLYDGAIPFAASSEASLGALFPVSFLSGPYGKKFSRCLSRLEELRAPRPDPHPDAATAPRSSPDSGPAPGRGPGPDAAIAPSSTPPERCGDAATVGEGVGEGV